MKSPRQKFQELGGRGNRWFRWYKPRGSKLWFLMDTSPHRSQIGYAASRSKHWLRKNFVPNIPP